MMKRKVCLALCAFLLTGSFMVSIPVKAEKVDSNQVQNVVTPKSLTVYDAPIEGAWATGTSYTSIYGDWANKSWVLSVLNVPGAAVAGSFFTALQNIGVGNVYIIETSYSAEGGLFYYKYDYYADSGYTEYIDTVYSYVYSIYA